MLMTCLMRGSRLTLNTDLGKIAADMRGAAPDYFLNVPALLERMRKAVDEQLWKTGGFPLKVYSKAKGAWARKHDRKGRAGDRVWLAMAKRLVFPTIRKKMIGSRLQALDLWIRAVEPGNTALFHDARNPCFAGLRPD